MSVIVVVLCCCCFPKLFCVVLLLLLLLLLIILISGNCKFQLLSMMTQESVYDKCKVDGLKEENINKNRDVSIVPSMYSVYIMLLLLHVMYLNINDCDVFNYSSS